MNWEEQVKKMISETREKAKTVNRFVDLEDMAVNVGEAIKNIMLQGVLSDKGDGRNITLPNEMTLTTNKPKNKGPKKNSRN